MNKTQNLRRMMRTLMLLCICSLFTSLQAQDQPMVKMQRMEVQRLMKSTDLGMLEAEYRNGTLTELKLDGKTIPQEEYSIYEDMLPKIHMPEDDGNPNIQRRELIIEEEYPNPTDMLKQFDQMDLDSTYRMLMNSFNMEEMQGLNEMFDMENMQGFGQLFNMQGMPFDSLMQLGMQFFDSNGGQFNFGGPDMNINSLMEQFFKGMESDGIMPEGGQDFDMNNLLEEYQKRMEEQEKKNKIKQI